MKVRGESWEDIVLRIIKNHKAPITQAELYQQIQEECPQFSEKQISANIYHKMFVLRKAQQVVRLRKDNSPGNYYVLTEFPKSKLAGFTRVG
jgi:Fe2+ or Zn2+ uptake regulation protein